MIAFSAVGDVDSLKTAATTIFGNGAIGSTEVNPPGTAGSK